MIQVAEAPVEGDEDLKKFARFEYPKMRKTQVCFQHFPHGSGLLYACQHTFESVSICSDGQIGLQVLFNSCWQPEVKQ